MDIKINKVSYGKEGFLVNVERQQEWPQESVVYGFGNLVETLVKKLAEEYGPEHLNKITVQFDGVAEGDVTIFEERMVDGKIPDGEKVIIKQGGDFISIGDNCVAIIDGTVNYLEVGRFSRVICNTYVNHIRVETGSIVSGTGFAIVGKSPAAIVTSYVPTHYEYEI